MNSTRTLIRTLAAVGLLTAASASAAIAQTAVVVTRDESTVWKSDFATVATVVRMGTTLAVVGQRSEWYEVVLPGQGRSTGTSAATGFIFASNVEPMAIRAAVPGAPSTPSTPGPPGTRSTPASPQRPPAAAAAPRPLQPPAVGILVFGQAGYTRLAARNSFAAVLGDPGGASFGGGAEMRLRGGFFLNGSVDYFRKTGQRVLIADGQVFRLGTPNTVTMMPIAATAGWRFVNDRAIPYVGGGAGTLSYKEASSFADPDENVSSRFMSYHVLGGVEFRNDWVGTAFEVQYSYVPDALGKGGASAAFRESNLGGLVARVRIIVGR